VGGWRARARERIERATNRKSANDREDGREDKETERDGQSGKVQDRVRGTVKGRVREAEGGWRLPNAVTKRTTEQMESPVVYECPGDLSATVSSIAAASMP
jgi:hypothetical protein